MKILFLDDAPWRHKLVRARMEDVTMKAAGVEVVHVWTVDECVEALQSKGPFDHIYLDHDLNQYVNVHGRVSKYAATYGEHNLDGADVASWMARNMQERPRVTVHSFNPDGARQMVDILKDAGFPVVYELFNGYCAPGDEDYDGPDDTMDGWTD